MPVNTIVFRFFFVLASENGAKIELVSLLFQKCRFYENLQKTLKKQWFLSIFQVSSFQKSTKNRCRNAFEKKIAKKHPKNRFGAPFWLRKLPEIAPKSNRDPENGSLIRSLFRDAMEITPESSEVNGGRDLWIAKMALHMIRST